MELKHAVGVCLISLFSATLVMLIARSLDSQAAARLEPHLVRIVEELELLRSSAGGPLSSGSTAEDTSMRDGLVVYYFYSNTRCPTCRSIESQSHETVLTEFAEQLDRGEIAWKTLNYEEPAVADLAAQFEIQVPVVVLARMQKGQIADWKRLDDVWGLFDDEPAFAQYVGDEIRSMLGKSSANAPWGQPDEVGTIPLPDGEADASMEATVPPDIPVPE